MAWHSKLSRDPYSNQVIDCTVRRPTRSYQAVRLPVISVRGVFLQPIPYVVPLPSRVSSYPDLILTSVPLLRFCRSLVFAVWDRNCNWGFNYHPATGYRRWIGLASGTAETFIHDSSDPSFPIDLPHVTNTVEFAALITCDGDSRRAVNDSLRSPLWTIRSSTNCWRLKEISRLGKSFRVRKKNLKEGRWR